MPHPPLAATHGSPLWVEPAEVVLLALVKLSRTVSGVKVMVAMRPAFTAVANGPANVLVSSAASLAVAWTTPFNNTVMLGPFASTCQFWLMVQQTVATVATVVSVPLMRLTSFMVPAPGEDCSRQKLEPSWIRKAMPSPSPVADMVNPNVPSAGAGSLARLAVPLAVAR